MNASRDSLPKLEDVLGTIDAQPDDWLFLPSGEPWSLESPCAILDTDDLDEDEDLPPLAKELDLRCTLLVSDLKDIRDNATAQLGSITPAQFFDAFLYYYENDAYKDFGRLDEPPSPRSSAFSSPAPEQPSGIGEAVAGRVRDHALALATAPFEPDPLAAAAMELGWSFEDLSEYASTPSGRLLEGRHPSMPQPLRISFDRETVVVAPLCALTQPLDLSRPEVEVTTHAAFHEVFHRARLAFLRELGDPVQEGQYTLPPAPGTFSYCVWRGDRSALVLVEHHEGDAHVGHDASVELRLYPLGGLPLRFPLETDILF